MKINNQKELDAAFESHKRTSEKSYIIEQRLSGKLAKKSAILELAGGAAA